MIVLGLILLLAGLLLGGYVVGGGLPGTEGTDVTLSLLGLTVQTSAVVIFAMGVLTLLLLELGVLAMRSGARKSSKRRAELQRLRRVEAEVQARQSAESQRNATATAAAPTAPAPFARREQTPVRPDDAGSSTDTSGYQPRVGQDFDGRDDTRVDTRTDSVTGSRTDVRTDVDPSTRPPAADRPVDDSTGSTSTERP